MTTGSRPRRLVRRNAHHPTVEAMIDAGARRTRKSPTPTPVDEATIRFVRLLTGRALDASEASRTGWKAVVRGSRP
jgi:hypothetical protein